MTTLPPCAPSTAASSRSPPSPLSSLFGVWVAGGVISNDFKTSMALTAAWFLLSGAACLLVARRSRALRVAVLGTYVVTAGAVGAYLGLTTLRDRVVHERVVTAAPATAGDARRRAGLRPPRSRSRAAASARTSMRPPVKPRSFASPTAGASSP